MSKFSVTGPALVVESPETVGLRDRTVVASDEGEVIVEPYFVGLCGTDLEIASGQLDPAFARYPLVLGHEWSGRVMSVGDEVEGIGVGDAVVVEGVRPCGLCRECRRGKTNLCENFDELGFTIDGAAGPAVATPAHLVHRLSGDLPIEVGALVEPSAVVLRGLREVDLVPGLNVLIVGDGTLALLAAQLIRMWSPATVTIAGRRSEQKALAESMSADRFTTDGPDDRAYDVVIEAAGNTTAVEVCFRSVRRGGQILMLGIAGQGKTASLCVDEIVDNDLRIRGSFSYTAEAWAEAVRLINCGSFHPLPIVTHRYPLQKFDEALDLLANPQCSPRGKILLDLTEGR